MDTKYLINPTDATAFAGPQFYDPWQQYGITGGDNRSQTAGLPVRCARIE
jgi:hypothetical protein